MTVWTPNFPASIDDATSLPDVVNGPNEIPQPSHINALRTIAIEIEKRIGAGSNSGVWNYLSATTPDGVADCEACYQFDKTASSLLDRSGNGNDLSVVYGTLRYSSTEGTICAAFGGDTELYAAATTSALRITGALTVEAVAQTSAIANQSIVRMEGSLTENSVDNILYGLITDATAGKIKYISENGSGTDSDATFGAYCPVGSLAHVAMTRDGSGNVRLYINGALVGTAESTTPPDGGSNGTLRIGGDQAVSYRWLGCIASARVTPDEMTAAEILSAYQQVKGVTA